MSQLSYPLAAVSRRTQTSTQRESLQQIDEALWAAYRKYDRSAVMEKLLQRFLRAQGNRRRQSCHA